INELDVSQPIALVFGTEEHGLSDEAITLADDFVRIPMYGFAESFNISVSAALSLQVLREKLMNSDIAWQLSDKELVQLKIEWCKTVIREGEKVYLKVVEDLKKESL
ncbi:MAG: TrmH family RNA methyltransferase, partial [Crocinitomicaceae bacterium]